MQYRGHPKIMARAVHFELRVPHHCGFKCHQRLWILSLEEVIQLAYETKQWWPCQPELSSSSHLP